MNITTHGTEGGLTRGCVKIEAYNNTLDSSFSGQRLFHDRAGNGVFFNNVATGNYHFRDAFAEYRSDGTYTGWGKCTGLAGYDKNDGIVYLSGSATGGAVATLVVSGAGWAPNQWVGYSAHNTSASPRTSNVISGNTSDTITVLNDHVSPSNTPTWKAGDHFEILRAYPCLDQVGWKGGTLLSGNPPQPLGWSVQTPEPFYVWNNTINGVVTKAESQTPVILENRDFFNGIPKPGYTPYIYPHPLVVPPQTNQEQQQNTNQNQNQQTNQQQQNQIILPPTTTTLTLVGNNPAYVRLGGVYSDPGVYVTGDNAFNTRVSLDGVDKGPLPTFILSTYELGSHTLTYTLNGVSIQRIVTITKDGNPEITITLPPLATTTPPVIPTTRKTLSLTKTLSYGQRSDDIKKLQLFLIDTGYLISVSNNSTNATGYFGNLTRAAVRKYQCEKIQVCTGSETTTGWGLVGKRTRGALGEGR